jgi:hypothetical protein
MDDHGPAAGTRPVVAWRSRLAGLAVLSGFIASGVWIVREGISAWRDGWVAPLQLSPDQEQVVQLRQNLAHEEMELARARAELTRTEAECEAIDTAIARLEGLRSTARASLAWQASAGADEVRALASRVAGLERQHAVLQRLRGRVSGLHDESETDLAAGLVDRSMTTRAGMALDDVDAKLLENELATLESKTRLQAASTSATAYRSGPGPANPKQRHPDVLAAEERELRLELEISRLTAERRGLEALLRAGKEGVERSGKLIDDIRGRPLYRALEAPTDVVFAPYSQLDVVLPDAPLVSCVFGAFACRTVGRVRAVVPGEAITKDAWGNPARGQYVLVQLDEATAIRQKVLRVRPR